MKPPKEIFKAYDIRGIVGVSLTPDIVEVIGLAIGSEARDRHQTQIVIGYDGRLSGPELAAALARGVRSTGIDVIDIGMVATPMLYFATYHLQTGSGVMVTGSHNPPDYNGLKIMLAGETLAGEAIQGLRQRIETVDFSSGAGTYRQQDIAQPYFDRILSDVRLARPMRIAIDAGNGVGGPYAETLFRALGCEVETLFCDVDGHFPNHHPDPSVPENLEDLIRALKSGSAEVGLAFDGDADRLGVVTREGHVIYPDRQLLLFAQDVLKRQPGATIIYDVKSTRNLHDWIVHRGGHPLLWKTGHSLMKAKMKETGAALGGELSGHLFFNDTRDGQPRWYGFDDGLYAGCRLLEILSRSNDASAVLNTLPDSVSTPELHIRMKEGEPHALIARLRQEAHFEGAVNIVAIDGLRVEYVDGFGLMRPSNTTPVVVLRFEATSETALKRIENQCRAAILSIAPDVTFPTSS